MSGLEARARAACAQAPLVIVADDLQWSDAASVAALGRLVERLARAPLFVLALARGELDLDVRGGRRLTLRPLPRRAAERLVDALVAAEPARRERIVNACAGVPGRIVAWRGQLDAEPPAALLAALHGQLERLPDEARRVLRAASVFGRDFPPAGVAALTGLDAAPWLAILIEAEIIERGADPRFRDEIWRAAAYVTLTDADRRLGHRLAAAYLAAGGAAPARVAEHLERGNKATEAAPYWLRAAEAAENAGDSGAAGDLRARGGACLDTRVR